MLELSGSLPFPVLTSFSLSRYDMIIHFFRPPAAVAIRFEANETALRPRFR